MSGYHILQILILQITTFGISCGIWWYEGRRLPFTNQRDLKKAVKNKWKEITIQTVRKSIAQWKNDWMRLESRLEVRFSTFSANHCDWIWTSCTWWNVQKTISSTRLTACHAVRRVELIVFCTFHQSIHIRLVKDDKTRHIQYESDRNVGTIAYITCKQ